MKRLLVVIATVEIVTVVIVMVVLVTVVIVTVVMVVIVTSLSKHPENRKTLPSEHLIGCQMCQIALSKSTEKVNKNK